MAVISVSNLSFAYPDCRECLEGVSFDVASGEFVLLCGATGSGKTTLLKLLKREISPFGRLTGSIKLFGKDISELSPHEAVSKIGYVCQDAEAQTVTDKVWHELSFGLEGLGLSQTEMHKRVGEMATYFGIEKYLYADTDTLSGGQKQLLALASVMVMNPDVLLLDEPISQLDPIAAGEFTDALVRVNNDFGVTVVISEHRTDALFALCDKVLLLDGGRLTVTIPQEVSKLMHSRYLPTPMRIAAELGFGKPSLSVKDCRAELQNRYEPTSLPHSAEATGQAVLTAKDIYYRYTKNGADVLSGASLTLYKSECFCLVGGNGHGKTTLLKVLCGLSKPLRGKVKTESKIAMLPQNVSDVFVYQTIGADLEAISKDCKDAVKLMGVGDLLSRHPSDLSGGERQKCAIAKLLLTEPEILLLDEPTKGLDADAKYALRDIISTLKSRGITVMLVTHDLDFAASVADRCAMLFDGTITNPVTPSEFFATSRYYTTTAARISRGIFDGAITAQEIISAGKKQ